MDRHRRPSTTQPTSAASSSSAPARPASSRPSSWPVTASARSSSSAIPSTSIFPRATGVSTRSMEIFRAYGLEDEVRRGGWRVIPRQATVDPSRRPLAGRVAARLPGRGRQPGGQPDDGRGLAPGPPRAAPRRAPPVARSARSASRPSSSSIDQDADGVTWPCRRPGERDDRTTERFAYVVGADGHRSTVRELVGIPMDGPDDLGRFRSMLFRADLARSSVSAATGCTWSASPVRSDRRRSSCRAARMTGSCWPSRCRRAWTTPPSRRPSRSSACLGHDPRGRRPAGARGRAAGHEHVRVRGAGRRALSAPVGWSSSATPRTG